MAPRRGTRVPNKLFGRDIQSAPMTSFASSRWTSVAAVAALLAIVATTLFPYAADARELPGDIAFGRMLAAEQTLLELTNADRAANGLPALEFDVETLAIARERAAAQLGPNNLSHYDEHGLLAFVCLLKKDELRYGLAGENLARAGEDGGDTIGRIEVALMNSPTHRKNILEKRFSRAAIGMARDDNGRIAFAEIFRGE